MRAKTLFLPVLLALSIAALAYIIYMRQKDDAAPSKLDPPTLTLTQPADTVELVPEPTEPMSPMNDLPKIATDDYVDPVINRPELFEVSERDMTPFLRSKAAKKFINELGYTMSELVQAQRDMRAEGFDETRVNDAGAIMRHLPVRHIGRISISKIDVPAEASAGEPIPFTLRGRKPSPTHSFTGFDILIQGPIIRINAKGHSDGDNDAGLGGRVELSGEIEPLDPGNYKVVVPELGPEGSYEIVVR